MDITTTLLMIIGGIGMWRGLKELGAVEKYAVALNLGMHAYLLILLVTITLTWATDVNAIIAYASRAFALFYMLHVCCRVSRCLAAQRSKPPGTSAREICVPGRNVLFGVRSGGSIGSMWTEGIRACVATYEKSVVRLMRKELHDGLGLNSLTCLRLRLIIDGILSWIFVLLSAYPVGLQVRQPVERHKLQRPRFGGRVQILRCGWQIVV
jgi:hypothetical protein